MLSSSNSNIFLPISKDVQYTLIYRDDDGYINPDTDMSRLIFGLSINVNAYFYNVVSPVRSNFVHFGIIDFISDWLPED